jgi:hypothetical protein
MDRNAFGPKTVQHDLEPVTAHVVAAYHNAGGDVGGSSFLDHGGDPIRDGYSVGGHEGVPEAISHNRNISPAQFQNHRDAVRRAAPTDRSVIAGTWAENGSSVLDASTHVHDRDVAAHLQAKRGERAVYNANIGEEENLR